jgi:hypothetical protein
MACLLVASLAYVYNEEVKRNAQREYALGEENRLETDRREVYERATRVLASIVLNISQFTNTDISLYEENQTYIHPFEIIESIFWHQNISEAVESMVSKIIDRFGIEIFGKPMYYRVEPYWFLEIGVEDASRFVATPTITIPYVVGIKINLRGSPP